MRFKLVPSKAKDRATELLSKERGYIDDLEVLDEFIAMCKRQRLKPVVWRRELGKIEEYTLDDLIVMRSGAEGIAEDLRPEK